MFKYLFAIISLLAMSPCFGDVASSGYVNEMRDNVQTKIDSKAKNSNYAQNMVLQTDALGNVVATTVDTDLFADGAIETMHLADGAVTNADLAGMIDITKLNLGTLPTSGKHVMIWNATTNEYVFEKYAEGIVLPAGYTRLEYIESTGTQYIDTGYIPNKNTITNIRFISTEPSDEIITKLLLGNIGIYNNNGFLISFCPRTRARQIFGDSWFDRTDYWTSGILFDVSMDSSGQTVNGVQTNWESEPSDYMISKPLLLFGQPERPDRFSNARVFYVNISEKDIVKLNFVPAKRNSDGEIGMYDTVTSTFFTNSGTGEFIAGPVVE